MTAVLAPPDAADAYARWIAKTGFADATRNIYVGKVRAFLAWVADHSPEYDDCLVDPHVRNYAVRDYRRLLMVDKRQAAATVELTMSALGSFYVDYIGLGKPEGVPRETLNRDEIKALPEPDLRRVLRVAERRCPRDLALVGALALCGIRVAEASALNLDDVLVTERLGEMQVRYGKGGKARKVPVGKDARALIRPWYATRREQVGIDMIGKPLFTSRQADRLSVRRIQGVVADIGAEAGLDISPHTLRHTFGRNWVEQGGDLTSLQKVLGHANPATTAGYARPSNDYINEMADRVGVSL